MGSSRKGATRRSSRCTPRAGSCPHAFARLLALLEHALQAAALVEARAAEIADALVGAACDLRYVEAKAAAGRAFELPAELRRVKAIIPAEDAPRAAGAVAPAHRTADAYARFAGLCAARLAARPWATLRSLLACASTARR